MGRPKKWTDEQLRKSVKKSISIRQVLIILGLKPSRGNYKVVTNKMKKLSIDYSHFLGQGWNTGLKFVPNQPQPLSRILVKNSTYQSHKLKKRLFKENVFEEKCKLCGWRERSVDGRIPLELDHINGIATDNRLTNLRILCPNCHSLQPTHRGLNRVK